MVHEEVGDHATRVITDLRKRFAALPAIPHEALRAEWRRLYRTSPPTKLSREVLQLGIAWKLQEKALGGMSPALKRRLRELERALEDNGERALSPATALKPGTRLMREWGGKTHDVLVLEGGFAWRGKTWRSLSAIARAITGAHWSGPRFFGLARRSPRRARAAR